MQTSKPGLASSLPDPALYFPLANGRYTVTPSLHRLGTDFGNGTVDTCLFQFDEEFSRFRENKRLCRAERLDKYVCEADFRPDVRKAVTQLLRDRLVTEYPNLFGGDEHGGRLSCRLTGETLCFDSEGSLSEILGADDVIPPYTDAIDALCCQFPEDLAVICRDLITSDDWLAKLHLCAPSHWAGEEKIGKSWGETHAPVPGMGKSRGAARSLVGIMIEREPTVRFTWGIEFDTRLNHHPDPPPGTDARVWNRRALNHADPEPFFLRVERQVIWGLPSVNAAVFTIRVYHTPGSVLRADSTQRDALCRALLSMSEESRQYKGLTDCIGDVLAYLSTRPERP